MFYKSCVNGKVLKRTSLSTFSWARTMKTEKPVFLNIDFCIHPSPGNINWDFLALTPLVQVTKPPSKTYFYSVWIDISWSILWGLIMCQDPGSASGPQQFVLRPLEATALQMRPDVLTASGRPPGSGFMSRPSV